MYKFNFNLPKSISVTKKLVCALVSIALVFGLLPSLKLIAPAYADNTDCNNPEEACQLDQSKEDEAQEAQTDINTAAVQTQKTTLETNESLPVTAQNSTNISIEVTNGTASQNSLVIQDGSSIQVAFLYNDPNIMTITYTDELGQENQTALINVTPNENYTFAYWKITNASGKDLYYKQGMQGASSAITIKDNKICATCLESINGSYFGDIWNNKINFVAGAFGLSPAHVEKMLIDWVDIAKENEYGKYTAKEYLQYMKEKGYRDVDECELIIPFIVLATCLEMDILDPSIPEGSSYLDEIKSLISNERVTGTIGKFIYNCQSATLVGDYADNLKKFFSASLTLPNNIFDNTNLGSRSISDVIDNISDKEHSTSTTSSQSVVKTLTKDLFSSSGTPEYVDPNLVDDLVDIVYSELKQLDTTNVVAYVTYLSNKITECAKAKNKGDLEKCYIYALVLVFSAMCESPLSFGPSYLGIIYYFDTESAALETSSIPAGALIAVLNCLQENLKSEVFDVSNFNNALKSISTMYKDLLENKKINMDVSYITNIGKYTPQAINTFIGEETHVFMVNDKYYSNLTSATKAAKDGDTITLLQNYASALPVDIINKNIIFDLNGNTITYKLKEGETGINATQGSFLSIVDSSKGSGLIQTESYPDQCLIADDTSQIKFISGKTSQDVLEQGYVYEGAKVELDKTTGIYSVKTYASMPEPASDNLTYNGNIQTVLYDKVGSTFTSNIPGSAKDIDGNLTLKDVPTKSEVDNASENGKYTLAVDVTIDPWFETPEEFDGHAYFDFYPVDLTYMSGSAEKVYDGTPLTNSECELTEGNLVGDETLTVAVTGTQTEVGESENTFTVTDGTGKVSNYNVTSEYGTLKVTAQTPVPGGEDINPATSGTSTGDNAVMLMVAFMIALLGCSIIVVRSRRIRDFK